MFKPNALDNFTLLKHAVAKTFSIAVERDRMNTD
jgi:hypothetical protein